MIPNIIVNFEREVIVNQLKKEMARQGLVDYKLWPSVHVQNKPKRTGISRAHKQIVEDALMNNIPEACIMEGDVWFPASDGYKYFLSKKPEDYDLYLGGLTRGKIENGIVKRYTGQFCYFIHEKYYSTFLATDDNLDIDGGQSGRGEFHVCYPYACFCYPGWSDNCNGVMDYSHLLIGREIYGFGEMTNLNRAAEFSALANSMK